MQQQRSSPLHGLRGRGAGWHGMRRAIVRPRHEPGAVRRWPCDPATGCREPRVHALVHTPGRLPTHVSCAVRDLPLIGGVGAAHDDDTVLPCSAARVPSRSHADGTPHMQQHMHPGWLVVQAAAMQRRGQACLGWTIAAGPVPTGLLAPSIRPSLRAPLSPPPHPPPPTPRRTTPKPLGCSRMSAVPVGPSTVLTRLVSTPQSWRAERSMPALASLPTCSGSRGDPCWSAGAWTQPVSVACKPTSTA